MLDLPDVNVLVALALPKHEHHERAFAWWSATKRFATTPITEIGLVRILMQPAVVGVVVSFQAAMQIIGSITSDQRAIFIPDDVRIHELAGAQVSGTNQITDLHLVMLARNHSAWLVTLDARLVTTLEGSEAVLI